jgi:hypothetical protein
MAEFQKSQYAAVYRKLAELCSDMILRKIVYRAARRAAKAGATAIKREIATETTMKFGKVGESVKEFTYGSPVQDYAIGIKIKDRPRPLSDFRFTPKAPKYGAVPVAEIYKGKKQRLSDGAFVQKMPSGHIGVFQRVGEKRLPIRELVGPSVTGIFNANEKIHDAAWDRILEVFEERLIPELNFALNIENK